VRAVVLDVDREKRRLRLGLKQLQPTSIDEYIAEHKEGDVVTGRMTDVSGGRAKVELGEGVNATCRLSAEAPGQATQAAAVKVDLSSLSTMLEARWKGGQGGGGGAKPEPVRAGQVRSFRIVKLDPATKRIELELA
jgi:small subunit ribosomal protein S1